jgi:negative regulator of flagellin synthesis FlgM
MKVKVNKPTGASLVNPYQKQNQKPNPETGKASSKKDQVQISEQAKAMLENKSTVDPARQEKVNQLKSEVQNGEYKVDSQKVAEKLYQFWFNQ